MPLRWKAALTAAALSCSCLASTGIAAAAQHPAAQPASATPRAAPTHGDDRVMNPDHLLPADWRSSSDRAVTVSGDGSGLHVLVADSKNAYQWHTAATLSEPGLTEDAWVGNVCLTGSGRRAVVSYAPRTYTDDVDTFDRGAFAAVVDLSSGAITKLPVTTTLAYFSPGCGTGETAVLTQANAKLGKTRLIMVDAVTGKVTGVATIGGQATSAVPLGDGFVAAIDSRLVGVSRSGAETTLTATSGPAFDVHVDATGAIAFMDRQVNGSTAKRYAKGSVTNLATGELGSFALTAGGGGHLFLTGKPSKIAALPSTMLSLPVDPGATVSSEGRIAVVSTAPVSLRKRIAELGSVDDPSDTDPVTINAVTAKGAPLAFEARTDNAPAATRQGGALSPALGGGTAPVAKNTPSAKTKPSAMHHSVTPADDTSNATVTVDENRTCAVARNDPETQIYQPTPNQVEWAVDDAIRGDLTSTAPIPVVRPANWKGSGLGAWSPQDVFPPLPLYGANRQVIAGGRVPAQVLLGIMAQESNLWQASGHDLPGQYGNPLVSNFYGTTVSATPGYQDSSWAINWAKADCGTGIGQVTDGMRLSDTTYTPTQQREIAVDYATNIAASLQILEQKWNELNENFVPMTINNDNPSSLENWFAALWDYNEGFNPPSPSGNNLPWGLGWGNNPANPKYPPTRHAFLDGNSYADAGHPQDWPYEEKVLGWAAWPIDTGYSYADTGVQNNGNTHGYQAAWWDSSTDRSTVKPPIGTFCTGNNACDPNNPPQCTDTACYTAHWYTYPQTTWKDCAAQCGNELITYKTLRTEPGDASATSYPTAADCAVSKLPSNAIIVDSLDQTPAQAPCASGSRTWSNGGSLNFTFNDDGTGHYRAKEDLHQLSVGFGGHSWFAHTRTTADGGGPAYNPTSGDLTVTGTWTVNQPLNGWTRVFVHIPAEAAVTQQAAYTITTGDGSTPETRVINTHLSQDTWVNLGVFQFTSNGPQTPSLSLTNTTYDGDGTADVTWDAAAFQPLSAKPADFVVQMGDSYASGEGAEPYLPGTDVGPYASNSTNTSPGETWNACRRSKNSWIRQTVLPRRTANLATLTDAWDPSIDYHTTACSGAFASQMNGSDTGFIGALGVNHEVPQLDSGFLDANTTLVALTIGGNDAGFSGVLQNCGNPLTVCPPDATVKTNIDNVTINPGNRLQPLLNAINAKAPNAKIILLGYPELFGAHVNVSCSAMPYANAAQINLWADYMASDEQKAVSAVAATKVPVTFYWPNTEFAQYRVCDGTHGINDVVSAPTGPGDFSCPGPSVNAFVCPSMESYHPNNSGTPRYALALEAALAAAKY